ncbi:MAG: hypothetical protein AAFY71_17920, partial [Bacteroidota bacterium]
DSISIASKVSISSWFPVLEVILIESGTLISYLTEIKDKIDQGTIHLIPKVVNGIEYKRHLLSESSPYFRSEWIPISRNIDSLISDNSVEQLRVYISQKIHSFQAAIDLGDKVGDNLQISFLLNNQLFFSKLLEYSSKDYNEGKKIDDAVKKDLIRLIKLKEEDADSFRVVSFFDPDDIAGFQIPPFTDPLGSEIFASIPIKHGTNWTVKSAPFRSLISLVDKGESELSPRRLLEDQDRLIISNGFDASTRLGRTNPVVINYLLDGYKKSRDTIFQIPEVIIEEDNAKESEIIFEADTIDGIGFAKNVTKGIGLLKLYGLVKRLGKVGQPTQLPYLFAEKELFADPTTTINGIKDCLNNSPSESSTVYILTVHGMKDKKPDHYDYMAKNLALKMGYLLESDSLKKTSSKDLPGNNISPTSSGPSNSNPFDSLFGIRELIFKNSEGNRIVFEIVHWSPMTRPVKKRIQELKELGLETARDANIKTSFTHQTIKKLVVEDGFVDVFLALGERDFRKSLGNSISQGLQEIYEKKKLKSDDSHNVFLITGSLGSGLLYEYLIDKIGDTDPLTVEGINSTQSNQALTRDDLQVIRQKLAPLNNLRIDPLTASPDSVFSVWQDLMKRKREREVLKLVMEDVSTWYMMTNQIALIGLKYFDQNRRSRKFEDQIWQELEDQYTLPEDQRFSLNMDVLAFHDPNDVLTFPVSPSKDPMLSDNFRVHNVPVRTANGFNLNTLETYKLLRTIDKKIYKELKKSYRDERKILEPFIEKSDSSLKDNKNMLSEEEANAIKEKLSELDANFKEIVNRNYELVKSEIKFVNQMKRVAREKENMSFDITLIDDYLSKTKKYKNRLRTWKRKRCVFLVPGFYEIIDQESREIKPYQPFIIRFDKAHDQVSKNGRVIDVMVNGIK